MAVSDRIAVMNRGSIVQQGTAEDLYRRPASEFVAQFIGRVNLVQGRVAGVSGATLEIEALGQRLRAQAPPETPLEPGAAVRLVLRPETIELAPDGEAQAADAAGAAATILSRSYLGEKIEYLVACGGETLQVARYGAGADESIAEGGRVRLRLPRQDVSLLP